MNVRRIYAREKEINLMKYNLCVGGLQKQDTYSHALEGATSYEKTTNYNHNT